MVPLHRSILVRLLATSIVVAVCAITGTAWLAVTTTTRAVRQEQDLTIADDRGVYDTLLGHAATHRDWSGAGELLDQLAVKTGRRITLLGEDRRPIADSGPGPSLAETRPIATVDALRVDGEQRFDPRVVGPYQLPEEERRELRERAAGVISCMSDRFGALGEMVETPAGRPLVRVDGPDYGGASTECGVRTLSMATATERVPLADLTARVLACLGVDPATPLLTIFPDFSVELAKTDLAGSFTEEQLDGCLARSREAQMRLHTAPPALLFITDPNAGTGPAVFTLSRDNLVRIVLVTGAVLLATVAFTVVAGLRLVRPLRALTVAAGAHAPMPIAGRDEIGQLATVLNELAARRDRAEDQRKAMISDIAHELRNPMTNIRSWLEAAEDGVTPTDAHLLALLLDETSQLARILDDLRDLAAADAGTLRIHPEPIRLGDALGPAFEAHRTAGPYLRAFFDPELPVLADPVRLRQIVGNLLSNAVRHTPPGGTVTLGAEAAAGQLVITVADTGTGIAPDDLPHVFDRFWRADHSRRRGTGGSGLGLAIVRDLVTAHGGDVDAASTPGRGTTVTVRLPHP
jgi:two-component system, OmpR family, sensor histidine kinase BaeS